MHKQKIIVEDRLESYRKFSGEIYRQSKQTASALACLLCSHNNKLVRQDCHLDILMKIQGEKTKTQEPQTQNSRIFSKH